MPAKGTKMTDEQKQKIGDAKKETELMKKVNEEYSFSNYERNEFKFRFIWMRDIIFILYKILRVLEKRH